MKADREKDLNKKWTEPVISAGFTAVPDLLFKYQNRLELRASELNLLVQLLSYWWKSDSTAYPGVSELAKRIGVSKRAIQKQLSQLEQKELLIHGKQISGLIKRKIRINEKTNSQQSNIYMFDGLVSALKLLRAEELEDEQKRNRKTPNSVKRTILSK